jgi:MFS superfamily sulfate permease-like transporter
MKKLCLWVMMGALLLPLTLLAATNVAVTNAAVTTPTVIALPGVTPTGQIDVVNLINLVLFGLTPLVVQGIKKLIPKLPDFSLNILAPVLGALIALLLGWIGVTTSTGWGAAIWGGLGTWLYELVANVKDHLSTPPSPPTG